MQSRGTSERLDDETKDNIQLAVSEAGDRHYQAKPVVVAGITGLVDFVDDPFTYRIGKNVIRSSQKSSLFPLQLQAKGADLGLDPPVEMHVDFAFSSAKKPFLQGKNGCAPCCGGVGTLYYSIPNLRLDPAKSRLRLKGEEVALTGGKFWFDHQWCTRAVAFDATVVSHDSGYFRDYIGTSS